MDTILQMIPIQGYKAVFDRGNEPEADRAVEEILEETDANLLILPVEFFALVRGKIPRMGLEETRIVGVYLDPDYGYFELCQRGDDRVVSAGRLLGYLPPEPGPGLKLLDNFRWITAARLDGRFIDEQAWKSLTWRKVACDEPVECL